MISVSGFTALVWSLAVQVDGFMPSILPTLLNLSLKVKFQWCSSFFSTDHSQTKVQWPKADLCLCFPPQGQPSKITFDAHNPQWVTFSLSQKCASYDQFIVIFSQFVILAQKFLFYFHTLAFWGVPLVMEFLLTFIFWVICTF